MEPLTATTGDVIRGAESVYRAAKELEKRNYMLGIAGKNHSAVEDAVQEAGQATDEARQNMRGEIRALADLISGPVLGDDSTDDAVLPETASEAPA